MTGYLIGILEGALLTVGVSLAALVVAVLLGLLGAGAKLSGHPVARLAAGLYTTVVRGVPDLVLMLLVFYGGTIAINRLLELAGSQGSIDVNPFAAGVLTIGFIYGAYMTEVFRGAIQAIPPGQTEAARAYGMGRWLTLRRIVLPQMVRHALPGFTNTWLVLIKATALVSLIGLADMTYLAKQASAATRSPFLYFSFTALLFLGYTSLSLLLLRHLQRRYDVGVRRRSA